MKLDSIVLRNTILDDHKIIVDMFTNELGRLSVITRFSSSGKTSIKKQMFVPLSLLEVEVDYNESKTLHKLKNASIKIPYKDIPFNSFKLSVSFYIAELTYYAVRGENENKPLFDFISNSLQLLDNMEEPVSNFHIVYMFGLISYLGFMPNFHDYRKGTRFDLRNACFVVNPESNSDSLNIEESSKVVSLARMNFSTMNLFKMSHEERNRIVEIMLQFYKLHIPGFPDLKSLDILKQLFS